MSGEKSTWQQMLATRAEWAEQLPSLGAEIRAMAREAAKDVRSTVMETFLGSPEHGGDAGPAFLDQAATRRAGPLP